MSLRRLIIILFFGCCLGLTNSIPVPDSDPVYLWLRQAFLRYHDLTMYQQSYPLKNQTLQNYLSQSGSDLSIVPSHDDHNVIFRFLPHVKLWQDTPQTILRVWAASHWQQLSLVVEPVVVSNPYGPAILGTNDTRIFSSSGVSGRLVTSLVQYHTENVSWQLGRSPIWWGHPWGSSLIQSGTAPTYDHFDMRLNFNDFQLEILAGQLGSEKTAAGDRIRRNIAGHRLSWLPDHGRWILGVGEQVLYTGINRSLEWWYLNPAVPYFFTALEEDEEQLGDGRDNDNSILFAFGRYVLQPQLSLFFELLIDEFQTKNKSAEEYPHSLGVKFGVDGVYTLAQRDIYFAAEYNRIANWTYLHGGLFTNWQNRDHAIGYPYGPDVWSVHSQAETWLSEKILLTLETIYLQKGSNHLAADWAAQGTVGEPFPTRPVTAYNIVDLAVSYYNSWGLLKAGWSNKLFPSAIAFGNDGKTPGGLYLEFQLVGDIGFKI